MAQEVVQGTGVQTILRKPYRATDMGGFTKSYVLLNGQIIKPSHKVRSRTGHHGYDIWYLNPGRYVIIDVNRANLTKPKPFVITVQCVDINTGVNIVNKREFTTMDYSIEDIKSWAAQIC